MKHIKNKARNLLLLLFFVPFSINSVTANYSFTALFFISKFKPIRNVSISIWAYIIFIFLSYLYGFIVLSQFDPYYLLRSSLSFYSYLFFVLLLFVNVDYSTDQICKTVLWLSIAYSFYVVINVAFRPEFSISNPYAIKGHMRKYVWDWPQRFPVLISFSLFYCLKLVNDKKIYFLFLMLILTCLYFTFTRTVYLAIISGIFCYTLIVISNLVNSKKRNPTKQRKSKKKLLFIIFLMIVSIKFLAFFDPYGIYAMIIERTIKPISFIFAGVEQFSDSDLSRIIYWSSILDIVDSSPFFGSGFGNIYLFESVIGSAHSQYMDILVRTGYAGFIFYLFFWIKALYFYLKKDQYIFCGLISIFVYGLFHETTKLTYSGVLFFLLLNKTYIQPCLFKAKD